ncbi:MAG: protein kinase domain-containing protein [Streptosporangiaceae bacterium]
MAQAVLVEPLRRWDPEQVGGYVVIGRLGAGAMGQVYLGRSAAGRLVAIKTIKAELAEEPDFRTRFGQEVAAARRVSGAFTAAVVAADSEAEVPWLATVYVPAPSLSTLVRGCGPLPAEAVRWLGAGCAEALESIHNAGLVHRDVKPANVLISPDGPRVIDFGLARAAERVQLTVTRASVGTPAYMAPEQARDNRLATSASDIYAVGATLLFAATGHAPYHGETVMDVLVRLATEPPDLSGLPAGLTEIVAACLERDPLNRPTSASIVARLAAGLDAPLAGSAPLPPAAIQLIEDYRRAPWPQAGEPDSGVAGDRTLGSQPASRAAREPSGDAGAPPRPGQAVPAPVRPGRRFVLVAAGAVAAGALIGAGWLIGARQPAQLSAQSRHSGQSGQSLQPQPGGQLPADQLGPVLGPPPQGAAPNPAVADPAGKPYIGLNQDIGDSRTIFVVHGQGWPPGKPVSVTLVGVGASSIHPVSDSMGTFNYAINQDHEFLRGGLPVGVYTVRVTDASGATATARFDVQRP